jgi:hypothetical protein
LARWRAIFGPDRWVEDIEAVRLIGLDAMLLGSASPEEAMQAAWLDSVMKEAGGRQTAWFLHRPLFLDAPDEPDTGYWSVKPQPRAQLMALVRGHAVGLVASGHLHKAHQFVREGTTYVWAPASSFLVGPKMQPPMPGEKQLGAVLYDFAGTRWETTIGEVPGLVRYWLDDVIDEVYPRPAVSGTAPG